MDEKELWERFCAGGKVEDYLRYRSCVNAVNKTELEQSDKDNRTGACDTRTEYR